MTGWVGAAEAAVRLPASNLVRYKGYLEIFRSLPQSLEAYPKKMYRLGYVRFLATIFQFILHKSPIHSAYIRVI